MSIMTLTSQTIDDLLLSLSEDEKAAIIGYGVALRLPHLRKRLFLAQGKVKEFQERYQTTLAELDVEGLPDDADYKMHEDYILWHHWSEVIVKTKKALASLERIANSGLSVEEMLHAGGE
jgi:hypothetical protein